jgi:hypothetical protein
VGKDSGLRDGPAIGSSGGGNDGKGLSFSGDCPIERLLTDVVKLAR